MTVSTAKPAIKKSTSRSTSAKAGAADGISQAEKNKAKMRAASGKSKRREPAVTAEKAKKTGRGPVAGAIGLGNDPTTGARRRPAWEQAWGAIAQAVGNKKSIPYADAITALADSVKSRDNVINVSLKPEDWARNTIRDGIKRGYFTNI